MVRTRIQAFPGEGEVTKKAELSSEDGFAIFYGFESFSCYFPVIDVTLNYNLKITFLLVTL